MEFSDTAALPTRFDTFRVLAVREENSGQEHLVVVRGEVRGGEYVPVVRRIPLAVPLKPLNKSYVRTKEARMGHLPAGSGGSEGEGGAP